MQQVYNKKRHLAILCFILLSGQLAASAALSASFVPDREYVQDRAALDLLQRDAFRYFWEDCEPNSGMAYEANYGWDVRPIAVGGSGFGIASLVVATDREWVSRADAVTRLLKITTFLRDKTPRREMHGAFPHWINGETGKAMPFGNKDAGADLVETSLLIQGLLIARAYFNGPGVEAKLRQTITELWEDVEWDWFTNGEDNGLYWHWDPKRGFHNGLKILGYNECLITYALAISSPTHPISRKAFDYWTSGVEYLARMVNGYMLDASPHCGGPLFLAHYSFIGLDPKLLADKFVTRGYFVRGVEQTLANRGYCLYDAPVENNYAENFWGLTASQTPTGYAVSDPCHDNGAVAPTAAISSMPYTPHYSLQVLQNLAGGLKKKAWGPFGPYDALSLRDDWTSENYLAIDQLPMVCMVENYRSGLLWDLLMSDQEIQNGLSLAGFHIPNHEEGFPEAVPALRRIDGNLVRDAYDIRRHPDTGKYEIPFFVKTATLVAFKFIDADGDVEFIHDVDAREGMNTLSFPQFMPKDGQVLTLTMTTPESEYTLPVRLH